MSARPFSLWTALCLMVLPVSSRASGEDLLLAARQGEVRLGPFAFVEAVQGVPLDLRASMFLRFEREGNQVKIRSRIVADFSDLQKKVGALIDRFPLPKDNCSHFGADNYTVDLWGKDLTLRGDAANLRLKGDAEIWGCFKSVPCTKFEDWQVKVYDCNPPVKSRILRQPFEALLPLRLSVSGAQAVVIAPGEPTVNLGGPLGGVTDGVLKIAGVDINALLRQRLDRVVGSELWRVTAPPRLLQLDPVMTRAEFLSNEGALAAEIEGSLTLDRAALLRGQVQSSAEVTSIIQ